LSEGRLTVEKRGAVGWIVFDQPAKMNAINGAMWRALPEAMARFDADPEVRCIAFRGAGTEAFAAGADISEFEKNRDSRAAVGAYDDLLDRVLHSIQGSPKPSVAMIYGYCLGGGLEIALACDLRYCGRSAQFGIPAANASVPAPRKAMQRTSGSASKRAMASGSARHMAPLIAFFFAGWSNTIQPTAPRFSTVRRPSLKVFLPDHAGTGRPSADRALASGRAQPGAGSLRAAG
jgi:enoyl-CoA hydratase/carnithine racemase